VKRIFWENTVTIQQLVDKHGVPVKIGAPNHPAFVVHTIVNGGWLVDYNDNKNHFVASCAWIDDYEAVK
jgi:hypothetical protein